jgi:hypothetical protein
MKMPSKKLLYPMLLLGLTSTAFATPVKYPSCALTTKVKDVAGSNGHFFDETCRVLYVLPPQISSMEITGYRPAANLDRQCEDLKDLEQISSDLRKLIKLRTERLLQYEKDIQEIEANLKAGLVPIGKSTQDLEERVDALTEKIAAGRKQIQDWRKQDNLDKLNFSKIEGGRGNFLVRSRMSELLAAYREANPKFQIREMVLDQAFLSANQQKVDATTEASMPAVLSLQLGGIEEMPLLRDLALTIENPGLAPQKNGAKIFGGALNGDIRVSNMGACALRGSLGQREDFSMDDVKAYIRTEATYAYQVQVMRKHSITYNLQELVRQIHQQTKKGGLFSRKTMNSFVDERRSTSWIEFHSESQDARFEYTDEYVREVKKEFIARALAQVVTIQTGSPVALLALIDASGKNGADVAGEQLAKCPGLYCKIGAAGFKVLSSIFGSESATSNLLKTMEAKATQTVSEKQMVPAYGTTVFR